MARRPTISEVDMARERGRPVIPTTSSKPIEHSSKTGTLSRVASFTTLAAHKFQDLRRRASARKLPASNETQTQTRSSKQSTTNQHGSSTGPALTGTNRTSSYHSMGFNTSGINSVGSSRENTVNSATRHGTLRNIRQTIASPPSAGLYSATMPRTRSKGIAMESRPSSQSRKGNQTRPSEPARSIARQPSPTRPPLAHRSSPGSSHAQPPGTQQHIHNHKPAVKKFTSSSLSARAAPFSSLTRLKQPSSGHLSPPANEVGNISVNYRRSTISQQHYCPETIVASAAAKQPHKRPSLGPSFGTRKPVVEPKGLLRPLGPGTGTVLSPSFPAPVVGSLPKSQTMGALRADQDRKSPKLESSGVGLTSSPRTSPRTSRDHGVEAESTAWPVSDIVPRPLRVNGIELSHGPETRALLRPLSLAKTGPELGSSRTSLFEGPCPPTLTREISNPQPLAYWAGRFSVLHDRLQAEESDLVLPACCSSLGSTQFYSEAPAPAPAPATVPSLTTAPSSSSFTSLQSLKQRFKTPKPPKQPSPATTSDNDEEKRTALVFSRLDALCKTEGARESLRLFCEEFARGCEARRAIDEEDGDGRDEGTEEAKQKGAEVLLEGERVEAEAEAGLRRQKSFVGRIFGMGG